MAENGPDNLVEARRCNLSLLCDSNLQLSDTAHVAFNAQRFQALTAKLMPLVAGAAGSMLTGT